MQPPHVRLRVAPPLGVLLFGHRPLLRVLRLLLSLLALARVRVGFHQPLPPLLLHLLRCQLYVGPVHQRVQLRLALRLRLAHVGRLPPRQRLVELALESGERLCEVRLAGESSLAQCGCEELLCDLVAVSLLHELRVVGDVRGELLDHLLLLARCQRLHALLQLAPLRLFQPRLLLRVHHRQHGLSVRQLHSDGRGGWWRLRAVDVVEAHVLQLGVVVGRHLAVLLYQRLHAVLCDVRAVLRVVEQQVGLHQLLLRVAAHGEARDGHVQRPPVHHRYEVRALVAVPNQQRVRSKLACWLLRCEVVVGEQRVDGVSGSRHVVALEQHLGQVRAAVVGLAHRLRHQHRVLHTPLPVQPQPVEHIVEDGFERVEVSDECAVEGRARLQPQHVLLRQLVAHAHVLAVRLVLGLAHVRAKAQGGRGEGGVAGAALVRAGVDDDGRGGVEEGGGVGVGQDGLVLLRRVAAVGERDGGGHAGGAAAVSVRAALTQQRSRRACRAEGPHARRDTDVTHAAALRRAQGEATASSWLLQPER